MHSVKLYSKCRHLGTSTYMKIAVLASISTQIALEMTNILACTQELYKNEVKSYNRYRLNNAKWRVSTLMTGVLIGNFHTQLPFTTACAISSTEWLDQLQD